MHLLSFLSFILFYTVLNTDGSKILGVFPSNVRSHFVMFEKLMKGLAKKGHQVDVISDFPLKEQIKNYKDISIRGSLPKKQNSVTFKEFIEPMSTIFWVQLIANEIGEKYCDIFKHPAMQNIINKSLQDVPYDLVITELFFAPCYFVIGRHLNIPIIAMSSNALYDFMNDPFGNPMNPSFVPSSLVSYSQNMNFWQRLLNTISTIFMKTTFNYHIRAQDKYVEKYFGPGYPNVYELQKDVALILVNSHFILNGIRPMTPAIIEVGGLHIEDEGGKLPEEIQKWLNESEHGFIYVSFGSMVNIESFPKRLLDSFYITFKNIAPIRVLMKIANDEELPAGLPKNVKTYSWFPQLQVLKHKNIKAFVTHGGLMGTMESIFCGIPMVGIPLFGDQHTNIYHYERQKIAISIDHQTITPESFTTAVKTVLSDSTYRNNVKRISELFMDRPNPPLETAIFWVEYVLRNGGETLKSPSIVLEWWQVQLLDVYGFLLFNLCITFYIIYLFLRTLIRFLLDLKNEKKNLSEIARKNL